MSKSERQLYNKAKGWWEREGKHRVEEAAQPEPAPKKNWPEWRFESFAELVERADAAAKRCLQEEQNEQ